MLLFDFDVHNKIVPVWIVNEALTAELATGFSAHVNGRSLLSFAPPNV